MELRTLNYFVAVVDTGSVSAAATALRITQPAVSRQIRQLERELGIELFTRRAGRVVLSAAGRSFLPHAKEVLQRADSARMAARSLAAGRLEHVKIAAPTTTLTDVITPFLATLLPEDPMPAVFESDSADALAALRHDTDLAIVTERPGKEFSSTPVAVLPVWAYVRKDHPWAERASVSLNELADEPLLVLTRAFRPRLIIENACGRERLTSLNMIECCDPQVALALAAAGRGIPLVSDDPRFELHPLGIDHDDARLHIELFAVWDPAHHAAASLRLLVDRLRAFCIARYGDTADPGPRPHAPAGAVT